MSLSGFKKMQIRMGLNGNSSQEEKIYDARMTLENSFADDPSFMAIVERANKTPISARINNFRKEGFLQPKMDIQSTMDNEFEQGDLFFFNEKHWLCTMKYNYHNIHYNGEVVQCNNTIRFQLPNSYEIYEYKAVVERPYVVGVSSGKVIQTSNKEYKVRLQLDEITKKLFLKQRIVMGYGYDSQGNKIPDVYTIDVRDSVSNAIMMEDGFLVLNFIADLYNPKDDNEKVMIANYRPKPLEFTTSGFANIKADEFTIKLGGAGWRTFTAQIIDIYGNEIKDYSETQFVWEFITEKFQDDFLIIEFPSNNICTIKCKISNKDAENKLLLSSTFNIALSAENLSDGFKYNQISKEIKIVSLV